MMMEGETKGKRVGGWEGVVERGIGMVEGKGGERDGLRGNEGAYCVEKEV